MLNITLSKLKLFVLLTAVLIFCSALPAIAGLNDLLGTKEVDETERAETIERIQSIQEKLQLLQEKLRVLERRKAAKEAAQEAAELGEEEIPNVQINWLAVDETTIHPGEAGIYTYLFFNGDIENTAAVGALEDFILTIETLPGNDVPASMANRFLLPVEKPQSSVSLGRQPYDFNLNKAYKRRLALNADMPYGPVLVSAKKPVDPYGTEELPTYLAVYLGHQRPERSLELARIWHKHESAITEGDITSVSDLFWELIDGSGPAMVSREKQRIQVKLPQP